MKNPLVRTDRVCTNLGAFDLRYEVLATGDSYFTVTSGYGTQLFAWLAATADSCNFQLQASKLPSCVKFEGRQLLVA